MAPTSTMNGASGARGTGTPCAIARTSISACSAMGSDMEKDSAVFHIKDAELGESAAYLTTTPRWPIPTAPQTSGPLDIEKDVNKGVMS
jgi:hypothetical protein